MLSAMFIEDSREMIRAEGKKYLSLNLSQPLFLTTRLLFSPQLRPSSKATRGIAPRPSLRNRFCAHACHRRSIQITHTPRDIIQLREQGNMMGVGGCCVKLGANF